jgi:hypothetical protein
MKLVAKPSIYVRTFLGRNFEPSPETKQYSTVEPQEVGNDDSCIVLELQDIALAIEEGVKEEGIKNVYEEEGINADEAKVGKVMSKLESFGCDPNRGIVRHFINLSDARHLTAHLIHELAKTDDVIAKKLETAMYEALGESEEGNLYGDEDGDEDE